MIHYIKDFLDHFLNSKDHLEGLFLYIFGAITVTIIQIRNEKQFIEGLKGKNKQFEAPEIILYIFCWLFPHMIMADQFLQFHLSIEGWYFMGILLLFGLTGRWGLEWLNSMRTGKVIEEQKTIETKLDEKLPQG